MENTNQEEPMLTLSQGEEKKKSGKFFGRKSQKESKRSKRKQNTFDEPEEQPLKTTEIDQDKEESAFVEGSENVEESAAVEGQASEESAIKPRKKERKSLKGRLYGKLSLRKSKKNKGEQQAEDGELDQSKDDLDASRDELDLSKDELDDDKDVTKEEDADESKVEIDIDEELEKAETERKFKDVVDELTKKGETKENEGPNEEKSDTNNENSEGQEVEKLSPEVTGSCENLPVEENQEKTADAEKTEAENTDSEGKGKEKKEINWELVGHVKEDHLQESEKLAKLAMGKMVRNARLTKTYCTCCTVM